MEIWWRFQIRYCSLPQMTLWTTNFLVYGPISTNFISFNWKFIGDSKFNIVVYLKCLSEPLKPNFLIYGLIYTRDQKLYIEVYLKWLSEPQSPISCLWANLNQIFFFQLEIHWGYRSLSQMSVWTTKAQFPCLWTDFNQIFFFQKKLYMKLLHYHKF